MAGDQLLGAMIEDFEPLIEKQNLTCKLVTPDQEPLVLGDRQRLTQVVANLLANAIELTSPLA